MKTLGNVTFACTVCLLTLVTSEVRGDKYLTFVIADGNKPGRVEVTGPIVPSYGFVLFQGPGHYQRFVRLGFFKANELHVSAKDSPCAFIIEFDKTVTNHRFYLKVTANCKVNAYDSIAGDYKPATNFRWREIENYVPSVPPTP